MFFKKSALPTLAITLSFGMIIYSNQQLSQRETLPFSILILTCYILIIIKTIIVLNKLSLDFELLNNFDQIFVQKFIPKLNDDFDASYDNIQQEINTTIDNHFSHANSIVVYKIQEMIKVGKSATKLVPGSISSKMDNILINNTRYHKLFYDSALAVGIFGTFLGLSNSVFNNIGDDSANFITTLPTIISALKLALGSTLVALIAAIPSKIFESSIEKNQDKLLADLDEFSQISGLFHKLQHQPNIIATIPKSDMDQMAVSISEKITEKQSEIISTFNSKMSDLTGSITTLHKGINTNIGEYKKQCHDIIKKVDDIPKSITENTQSLINTMSAIVTAINETMESIASTIISQVKEMTKSFEEKITEIKSDSIKNSELLMDQIKIIHEDTKTCLITISKNITQENERLVNNISDQFKISLDTSNKNTEQHNNKLFEKLDKLYNRIIDKSGDAILTMAEHLSVEATGVLQKQYDKFSISIGKLNAQLSKFEKSNINVAKEVFEFNKNIFNAAFNVAELFKSMEKSLNQTIIQMQLVKETFEGLKIDFITTGENMTHASEKWSALVNNISTKHDITMVSLDNICQNVNSIMSSNNIISQTLSTKTGKAIQQEALISVDLTNLNESLTSIKDNFESISSKLETELNNMNLVFGKQELVTIAEKMKTFNDKIHEINPDTITRITSSLDRYNQNINNLVKATSNLDTEKLETISIEMGTFSTTVRTITDNMSKFDSSELIKISKSISILINKMNALNDKVDKTVNQFNKMYVHNDNQKNTRKWGIKNLRPSWLKRK